MSEYVKPCDKCGGTKVCEERGFGLIISITRPYCNGTGQQLVKPKTLSSTTRMKLATVCSTVFLMSCSMKLWKTA